jgi:uncharacterized protein with HEPN domain
VEAVDFEAFSEADVLQRAVIRGLQVNGKAAGRISDETRDGRPEIDLRAIVGMRNRLVHGDFTVRLDVV